MSASKKNSKLSKVFSLKSILSLLSLGIVIFIIYRNWGDIMTAFEHLRETNLFILLLLIPEQFLMLYSSGKIFFSYKESASSSTPEHDAKEEKPSPNAFTVVRIALESAFTRQAYPSAGIFSAAFLSWRLKPYGFSSAQTSFIYILRYFAIVCTNQIQTLLAVIVLLSTMEISPAGKTILILATFIAVLTGLFLVTAIVLIASKRRITWFAEKGVKFTNFLVRTITFGKKRKLVDVEKVEDFLIEMHENYLIARKNLKILKKPIFWGMFYSFFEIATYWLVAISLGYPKILPQIMIGEAVGSVAGIFLPYGLYELGMAGAMASLNVELGLASLIVIITRVIVLGENLILGYLFYQHAILRTKALGKSTFTPPKETT